MKKRLTQTPPEGSIKKVITDLIESGSDTVCFYATRSQVNSRTTVSLDTEHKITLTTDNPQVTEISKDPADTLYGVFIVKLA